MFFRWSVEGIKGGLVVREMFRLDAWCIQIYFDLWDKFTTYIDRLLKHIAQNEGWRSKITQIWNGTNDNGIFGSLIGLMNPKMWDTFD